MEAIDAIRTALMFGDMGMKHLSEMSDTPLLPRMPPLTSAVLSTARSCLS
jgi:hypothetical protein